MSHVRHAFEVGLLPRVHLFSAFFPRASVYLFGVVEFSLCSINFQFWSHEGFSGLVLKASVIEMHVFPGKVWMKRIYLFMEVLTRLNAVGLPWSNRQKSNAPCLSVLFCE